jgi:hypothetical protein
MIYAAKVGFVANLLRKAKIVIRDRELKPAGYASKFFANQERKVTNLI